VYEGRVTAGRLVLGPLLRYVDGTSATIWVETAERSIVTIRTAGRAFQSPTFTVHGHHYALVEVSGLEPGSIQEYAVDIGGEHVWPPGDSPYPPSRIATFDPGKGLRLAFGSCRTSAPHDADANKAYGVDALRAYALRMASDDSEPWPDHVLFLGDQVYADETSDEMREFIASRRSLDEPPGEELKDYEEYTHLYQLAWSSPVNRWLLSTLPSMMIFDDHDLRDDWNTSKAWREKMARKPWWRDRMVGGLASYWVYQHLGNLSPQDRAADALWAKIAAANGEDRDWGDAVDELVESADEQPDSYRWSYLRDFGRTRLVVVDSRCARVLDPQHRSMLGVQETKWLDGRLRGDFDHVLVGTSLPFFLSRGLHFFEAWSEAVTAGAWGKWAVPVAEKVRQAVDLEHWAAFHDSFQRVARMAGDLLEGRRGPSPASVVFLSGDVHHSYVAEVPRRAGAGRIVQAVCSPIRNPMPRSVRVGMSLSWYQPLVAVGQFLARAARVEEPLHRWELTAGPWFDNALAVLQVRGRAMTMWWDGGVVEGDGDDAPVVRRIAELSLDEA
jgi:phosphodiesterase/alkaline phosphatase D-like protein